MALFRQNHIDPNLSLMVPHMINVDVSHFESPNVEGKPDLHSLGLYALRRDQPWILSKLTSLFESGWVCQDALADALMSTLDSQLPAYPEQVWRLEHSLILRHLNENRMPAGIYQWILLSALVGFPLNTSFQVNSKVDLFLLGSWFTVESELSVKQVDGSLLIHSDGVNILSAQYDRVQGCWIPSLPYGEFTLIGGKRIELVPFGKEFVGFFNNVLMLELDEISTPKHQLSMAAIYLERTSGRYLDWVKSGLNQIMIFGSAGSEDISFQELTFSVSDTPGVIFLRMPFEDERIIPEALVHEVSHTYINALSPHVELYNGNDLKEYYSPLKKKNRPLPMIVLSYHAVLNIMKFLYDASVNSDDSGMAEFQLQRHENYKVALDLYSETILHSSGMSDAGKIFISSIFYPSDSGDPE